MNHALDLARRSRCVRDQVGCVIVTSDNRINASSYNGPPPAATHVGQQPLPMNSRCDRWCPRAINPIRDPGYADCYSNHAEQNALVRSDYTQISLGTIYVSSTPCTTCAKGMASSGVSRVVFRIDPELPRDPEAAEFFLQLGGLEVNTI